MNCFVETSSLLELLCKQIDSHFQITSDETDLLGDVLQEALAKSHHNFLSIHNKYYSDAMGEPRFNPFHSGQYTIFLYYLSRIVAAIPESDLADKIYYLNRVMNGVDLFYQTELPDVFFLDHPLGSIMGKASYSDYFSFQQGCTVGNNHGHYPNIGKYVRMFANSTIIGKCNIGENVFISAGAMVKDVDIPDNTIVFGQSPQLKLKQMPEEYFLKASPFKQHHA